MTGALHKCAHAGAWKICKGAAEWCPDCGSWRPFANEDNLWRGPSAVNDRARLKRELAEARALLRECVPEVELAKAAVEIEARSWAGLQTRIDGLNDLLARIQAKVGKQEADDGK